MLLKIISGAKITMIKKKFLKLLILLIVIPIFSACSSILNSEDSDSDNQLTKENIIKTYADIVYASYQDSLTTAQTLETAIDTLVATPTDDNLTAAREAWLAARIPYGQTEGYRFYDGPIDDTDGPEGQLNAWPLDEVYIDYVDGNSSGGIVNDTDITITKAQLARLNEVGGDKNISTGYHAIEFLLWGQDLTEGPGAGVRAYTDYVTGGSGTNSNQDRRGLYLQTVTELLIDDLENLVAEWAPNSDSNYRATLLTMDKDEAIAKILRGVGTLSASELSTERMATPLAIQEREEEHSCFSDNTHVDIVQNTLSIKNVLMGSYTRVDGSTIEGASIYAYTKIFYPSLAATLKSQIDNSWEASNEIESPFDQEILGSNAAGNARVQTAITNLQTLGQTIVTVGTSVFGKTINTSL